MIKKEEALSILYKNLLPAFGCTDPATPALAAAIAYREAKKGDLKNIKLIVSNDIYKGAYSVIIPGTNEKGLAFAVALGIACGDPDKGLMTLEGCSEESIEKARQIIKQTKINIKPDSTKGEVYVELFLETGNGKARVIFNGRHDQYCYLEVDGIAKESSGVSGITCEKDPAPELPEVILDLCSLVGEFSEKDLEYIQSGIEMNEAAGMAGLHDTYGMSIARALAEIFLQPLSEMYHGPKVFASAAGDARMGGCNLPVMSVFGSGNQGALIFNCINRFGEIQKTEKTTILRAIALSAFLAGIFNKELKEGTPFCDCALVAATATSAGIAYLMGGNPMQIENAMQLTISSMAGLFCDGAKPNCAQKISLGAGSAIENALLAVKTKEKVPPDGILGNTYIETIKNLCEIGTDIRVSVEQSIVNILSKKDQGGCQ